MTAPYNFALTSAKVPVYYHENFKLEIIIVRFANIFVSLISMTKMESPYNKAAVPMRSTFIRPKYKKGNLTTNRHCLHSILKRSQQKLLYFVFQRQIFGYTAKPNQERDFYFFIIDIFTSNGVSCGPNITAFQRRILFSPGAPLTPAGGSSYTKYTSSNSLIIWYNVKSCMVV